MNPSITPISIVFAAAGSVVGSFIATSVVRNQRGQTVVGGRSGCDHCGVELGYAQTLPLISYVSHRGVCRTCGGPIAALHLAGEASGAVLGFSVGLALALGAVGPLQVGALLTLGLSLLALSLVDLRTQRIPDGLTALVLLSGATLSATDGSAVLLVNLAWSAGVFVALSGLRLGFAKLKGEHGLGLGDVKLLSALALWLGPLVSYALVAACIAALLARTATNRFSGRVAFGPWIALGAWTVGLMARSTLWPV